MATSTKVRSRSANWCASWTPRLCRDAYRAPGRERAGRAGRPAHIARGWPELQPDLSGKSTRLDHPADLRLCLGRGHAAGRRLCGPAFRRLVAEHPAERHHRAGDGSRAAPAQRRGRAGLRRAPDRRHRQSRRSPHVDGDRRPRRAHHRRHGDGGRRDRVARRACDLPARRRANCCRTSACSRRREGRPR